VILRTILGSALLPLVDVACGDNRGGSVPAIRSALAKYPTVEVVDVVGHDEIWPFFGPISIRADWKVAGAGRLLLCNLTPDRVSGQGPFILARVGRWTPNISAEREMGKVRYVAGCPNSVDVAPGSPFLELLPFPLTSVGEAIDRYDDLNRVIESWPERPQRFRLQDGSWMTYWRSPADGSEPSLRPSRLAAGEIETTRR
jgi:hypothetical protein